MTAQASRLKSFPVSAFSICLLLLSIAYRHIAPGFSFWFWVAGSMLMTLSLARTALAVMRREICMEGH